MDNRVTFPFDVGSAITSQFRLIAPLTRFGNVILDTEFGEISRAIIVTAAGAVTIQLVDGTVYTIPVLSAGVYHPICAMMIKSAGTTATGIGWGS